MADARRPIAPVKARGSASRLAGRFGKTVAVGEDDGRDSVHDHARRRLVTVQFSLASLDNQLSARVEPRAIVTRVLRRRRATTDRPATASAPSRR